MTSKTPGKGRPTPKRHAPARVAPSARRPAKAPRRVPRSFWVAVALGWLLAQVAAAALVESIQLRVAIAIGTLLAVPLVVVLVLDPRRRKARR